jgi:heme/copper-type cytochrome/quinol oxidase subunit 1
MPRLSVWFVRAALLYLASGFTFGGLMLADKGLHFLPSIWRWLPVHMELLLMGWLVQLAMGVAFWILPRHKEAAPRGNEKLAWLSFGMFNLGIGLVVAEGALGLRGYAGLGRGVEVVAVLIFAAVSWRRVRPFA